jgi:hypothetical protein
MVGTVIEPVGSIRVWDFSASFSWRALKVWGIFFFPVLLVVCISRCVVSLEYYCASVTHTCNSLAWHDCNDCLARISQVYFLAFSLLLRWIFHWRALKRAVFII